MSYQSADQKKEEFRKYLEKHGVVAAMTKGMVALFEEPERPEKPLDYLRNFLDPAGVVASHIESLKNEIEQLQKENEALRATVTASASANAEGQDAPAEEAASAEGQ